MDYAEFCEKMVALGYDNGLLCTDKTRNKRDFTWYDNGAPRFYEQTIGEDLEEVFKFFKQAKAESSARFRWP